MAEIDDSLRRGDVFREPSNPDVYYLVTRDPTHAERRDGGVWFRVVGDLEEKFQHFLDVELVYPANGDFEKGHLVLLLREIYQQGPVPEDLKALDRHVREALDALQRS